MTDTTIIRQVQESPVELLKRSIRLALQQLAKAANLDDGHLEDAGIAVGALPLPTAEYARAMANLQNAAAYVKGNERGAAAYELRSVLRRLVNLLNEPPREPRRRLRR